MDDGDQFADCLYPLAFIGSVAVSPESPSCPSTTSCSCFRLPVYLLPFLYAGRDHLHPIAPLRTDRLVNSAEAIPSLKNHTRFSFVL